MGRKDNDSAFGFALAFIVWLLGSAVIGLLRNWHIPDLLIVALILAWGGCVIWLYRQFV